MSNEVQQQQSQSDHEVEHLLVEEKPSAAEQVGLSEEGGLGGGGASEKEEDEHEDEEVMMQAIYLPEEGGLGMKDEKDQPDERTPLAGHEKGQHPRFTGINRVLEFQGEKGGKGQKKMKTVLRGNSKSVSFSGSALEREQLQRAKDFVKLKQPRDDDPAVLTKTRFFLQLTAWMYVIGGFYIMIAYDLWGYFKVCLSGDGEKYQKLVEKEFGGEAPTQSFVLQWLKRHITGILMAMCGVHAVGELAHKSFRKAYREAGYRGARFSLQLFLVFLTVIWTIVWDLPEADTMLDWGLRKANEKSVFGRLSRKLRGAPSPLTTEEWLEGSPSLYGEWNRTHSAYHLARVSGAVALAVVCMFSTYCALIEGRKAVPRR